MGSPRREQGGRPQGLDAVLVLGRWMPPVGLFVSAVAGVAMGIADLPFEYPAAGPARLEEVRTHEARAIAVGSLFLVSQLSLLPGIFRTMRLPKTKGAMFATVGGGLVLVGIFGHAVAGGAHLLQLDMADPQGNQTEMAQLYERSQENPVYLPFAAMGLAGFVLGFVLLCIALLRSKTIHWWIPTTILAGLLAEFGLGSITYGSLVGLTIFGLGLIGLATSLVRAELVHGQFVSGGRNRP